MNEEETHWNPNNKESKIMDEKLKGKIEKMTEEEVSAILQQSLATSMRDHPYLSETRRKELEKEAKMEPLEWLEFVSSESEKQRNEQNQRKQKS